MKEIKTDLFPANLLKSSGKTKGEIVGKTEETVNREKQGVLYEEKTVVRAEFRK